MLLLRSRVSIAAAVALVGLLAATTLTFAAVKPRARHPQRPAHRGPATLVVPNVEGKAYVFAEGMLEDAGFAWRVTGRVHGFAANTVVAQSPAPRTTVVDTGAPLVVLALARNSRYAEAGIPMDAAPFASTAVRLPATAAVRLHRAPRSSTTAPKARPASSAPHAAPKSRVENTSGRRNDAAIGAARHAGRAGDRSATTPRPRAFIVRGAPKEPLDEMPLPARAKLLRTWVASHRKPTPANVRHWLYQHAWIVDGARFGWWHGEQALQTLISVDHQVERQWKMGHRSEAVARTALAEVRARTH
jgi:PASTA domain